MSDLNEWVKQRRRINQATAWNTSNAMDAYEAVPALLVAVEKVLELHKPFEQHGTTYCEQCSVVGEDEDYDWYIRHPCPTVRAIEGEINE